MSDRQVDRAVPCPPVGRTRPVASSMLKFGGGAALIWHRPRSGRSTLTAADSTDPVIDYGVAAGTGDGEPKLKFTVGAFSAPA